MRKVAVSLPIEIEARLTALARRRGRPKSALAREAIELFINAHLKESEPSVLDLVRDLRGIADGPKDLSTNKKYMRGFGRSRTEAARRRTRV
jgi:predicted DNA-binding protein